MVVVNLHHEIPKVNKRRSFASFDDDPPNMSSTFFNITYVKPGSSAQQQCVADGDPKPTYSWTKDGVVLSNDAQYDINANTGDIKIQNVTAVSGEGTYQCFAQNSQGTALSGFWDVKVAYLTNFVKARTTSQKVFEYAYYSLQCQHQPSSVPASKVDWLVGDGDNTTFPTTKEDKRRSVVDADGTLHFQYVTYSDRLISPYRCKLFNDNVNVMAVSLEKFNLDVLRRNESNYEPILKYSKPIKMPIGSKATLLCIFAGIPIPTVNWTKDGVPLPKTYLRDGTQRYKIDPEDSTGRKLIISKLEFKDEGNYTCRATNAYGTKEGIVQVMVTGPLQLNIKSHRSTRIPVGETAIFQCDTDSFHVNSSSLVWMKNGEPIIGYEQDKVIGSKFYFSADLKQLEIRNVSPNDTMCLQCVLPKVRQNYSNPKQDVVGTALGNECLKVLPPKNSEPAKFNPWYIVLILGIIGIICSISLFLGHLYRKHGSHSSMDRKKRQAGDEDEYNVIEVRIKLSDLPDNEEKTEE